MSIEKEISLPKFQNQYQKASVNLLFTANWFTEKFKDVLKPYGITPTQFNILRILRGSKQPISTLQIRDRMLDKMCDASRLVERMQLKGLVDKKISEYDKRLVDITITKEGLDLLAEIDIIQHQIDGIASNLTIDEAILLNQLLDKIRDGQ